MKTHKLPPLWFLLLLGIVVCKRIFFHTSGNAFADSYLLDLLCIPLVMEGCKWILEKLLNRHYRFTEYHCIVAVLYFSLVFEWFLPQLSNRYHADIYDVLCYGVSTIIWYVGQTNFNAKRMNVVENA